MTTKYTPGPFTIKKQATGDYCALYDECDIPIAVGMKLADAKLYASAPELLEFVAMISNNQDEWLAKQAQELVLKATT